jgi:hypothetical protein
MGTVLSCTEYKVDGEELEMKILYLKLRYVRRFIYKEALHRERLQVLESSGYCDIYELRRLSRAQLEKNMEL